MRVKHISRPLSGERVIGVEPPLKPSVDAGWQRRLNLYTGRSLSDAALTTEQSGRAGRLATRGQMVSPGVVNGLIVGLELPPVIDGQPEVRLRRDPEALLHSFFFHISSGTGIMPSGEDVVLSRNIRVAVGNVPVYTTVDNLTTIKKPQSSGRRNKPIPIPADRIFGGDDSAKPKADAPLVLKPRRMGPSLIELARAGVALPRASILLLQPIILKRVGEFDEEDPCEQDPQNYAFEDWQLVDGCQLVLYTWPTELIGSLPLPEDFMQWRNSMAYAIFEAEMNNADQRAPLPWEEIGLPLGLVGFDVGGMPLFVDRFSVVRAGGKPKRRSTLVPDISDVKEGRESEEFEKINRYSALVPGAGHPFVWQARLQQFSEQLVELMPEYNKSDEPVASQLKDLAREFRFLPPAGLLPKDALTVDVVLNENNAPRVGQIYNNFFPTRFDLNAVPVPVEQLDVVINQSASLSRFDTNELERLRVLVPVPQIYYEPNLLQEEKEDPEFRNNIAVSLRKLGKWMRRRSDVYQIGVVINREINGPDDKYPELELMSEEEKSINLTLGGIDPLDTADDPQDKELRTPEETYRTSGTPLISTALKELKDRINQGTDFPRKVLTGEIKGVAKPDMIAELGLEGFIDYLEEKVRRADDIIDFGFVRVQTDIYRYRQLMLGGTDAMRLATSTALASIARGETAMATKDEIIKFVHKAKTTDAAFVPQSITSDSGESGSSGDAMPIMTSRDLSQAQVVSSVVAAADVHTPNPATSAAALESSAVTGAAVNTSSTTINRTSALTGLTFTEPNPVAISTSQIGITSSPFILKQATAATLFKPTVSPTATIAVDFIRQQTAIVGRPLDFRTVTVAERIKQAPAPEAKDFTVSSKYEVLKAIEELAKIIVLDDLMLPGFYDYKSEGDNLSLQTTAVELFDRTGKKTIVQMKVEVPRTIKFIVDNKLSAQVLSGLHDLDPTDGDEPAFFAAGVRASDHTIAYLRIVEGRIQAYRNIIADCRKVLSQLMELAGNVASRLNVIEDHLAEMRHDLAVARALKADEDLRVDNINKRRVEIIREHVSFLAFCRERTTDLHDVSVKVRELDPAEVVSTVPACLAREVSSPPELHAMADLLRDAPVKWFTNVHPLLDKFDRLDYLHRAVVSAKARANTTPPPPVEPATRLSASSGFFGQAIGQVVRAQQGVVSQMRVRVAQLDLSAFTTQSWQVARDQAREVISFGDLIDGTHGRGDISQQAAREFADITHVAACLYSALSVVLPVIRLNWAERISQFDTAVDLRNLSSLPRWGEIAYLDRREMQTYADWLFSRVDRKQPEAISLINDLVRVCILLASHAPVNQITSAHVSQKTEVTKGGQVTLTVEPSRVKIGMEVLMYRAGQIAARGIVEDLTGGRTAARVTQVYGTSKTTSLEENDHVQIAEANAFNRNPLTLVKGMVKAK